MEAFKTGGRYYWNHFSAVRDYFSSDVYQSPANRVGIGTNGYLRRSNVLLEGFQQKMPQQHHTDHCGFADVVTKECGIKIAVQTPRQFAADLVAATMLLANDEEKRRRLAKGALRRIHDFSWENKARKVNLIYQRMVSKDV